MEENKKNLSSTGLDENIAALLTYIGGFVTGIIFIAIEKKSKFVLFNAWQSLILFGGLTILWIVFQPLVMAIPIFLTFLFSLFWLAVFILFIILAVKAYQGEEYLLPVIGQIAKRQAEKQISKPKQEQTEPENKEEENGNKETTEEENEKNNQGETENKSQESQKREENKEE